MLAAFRAAARELSVRVRQTGGQTTLFLVLFLFLFGALGAAVVDVGPATCERHGARLLAIVAEPTSA